MVDERTSVSDMKKLSKIYYSILDNYFAWAQELLLLILL
jgi:hypothetical protein